MQILWISHAIPYPPKAGFLLRAYNLLREVARYHTVDLVAFVQEPWLKTIFHDVDTGVTESRAALSSICREVHFLPIDSMIGSYGRYRTALRALYTGRSYTTSWLDQPNAAQLIGQLANSHRYDLVHFDTIGLAPYLDLAGSAVTTLGHHNIESHLFTRRSQTEQNLFKRLYYAREGRLLSDYEKKMASRVTANITCSALDSDRLRELAPDVTAYCVPNGVDCSFFQPQPETEHEKSLLFLGTLNWHPNVDAMMFFLDEVWELLRQAVPDVKLHIVGANAPRKLTELAARKAGVRMHGFVDDVRPYFAQAQIFVCPIMDGGGTKLKLLDAFAMGKAVIAHPIALEGIDAVPGTHVEIAETPSDFVRVIKELLDDPARRAALGANARQLVEDQYSFAAIGKSFASLLADLAKTPTP